MSVREGVQMKRRPLARNCFSNGEKVREEWLCIPLQRMRESSQLGECSPNQ